MSRARRWTGVAAGLVISGLLLWWAVRGLDLRGVAGLVRTARPGPVVLAVALATAVFPMRMLRWRWLLREPDGVPLRPRAAWHAIAIGFTANNLLPLRAGEVIRAWTASRLAPVRWSSAFASVAVERVLDALTVVGLLVAALLLAPLPAELRIAGLPVAALARRVGLAGLGALVVAGVLLARPDATTRLLRRVIPFRPLAERAVALFDGIREGLAALRSAHRLGAAVAWSLAIWSVNALSFYVLFAAFGLPTGFAGALVLQGAIVFGIAIPSSPGFIGVFEAAIVFALGLFGVAQDRAFAYAVTYHVATFLPITILGFLSLARTHLHWRDLRERPG